MSRLTRDGTILLPNPSRDTKFSGANADREILTFPFQLTTSRIGKPYPVDIAIYNIMCDYDHNGFILLKFNYQFRIVSYSKVARWEFETGNYFDDWDQRTKRLWTY